MDKKIRLAILVACTTCLVGCGFFRGSDDEFARPRIREVTLLIINQNYYDARLFARTRNGRRISIGNVTGFNEKELTFRWEYIDLQVEINLLSVGRHLTPWRMVEGGDELELVIDPSLDKRIRTRR